MTLSLFDMSRTAFYADVVRNVSGTGLAVAVVAVSMTATALGANAPRPTSGRCAGAWNRAVPQSIRTVLTREHVRQATAENIRGIQGTVSWRKGGTTSSRSEPFEGCVIVFMLPRTVRTLTVTGTWKNGSILEWRTPMYRPNPDPTGSGNACVGPDGTIHHVGRFTAAARCT
jgi:hypothetical protein